MPVRKPAAPVARLTNAAGARRWRDAVGELTVLQDQYAAWLAALPDSLRGGATVDALLAICDLDLADLQVIDLPRGFGRD